MAINWLSSGLTVVGKFQMCIPGISSLTFSPPEHRRLLDADLHQRVMTDMLSEQSTYLTFPYFPSESLSSIEDDGVIVVNDTLSWDNSV